MRNEKTQKNWFKENLQTAITVGTLIIGTLNFFIAIKLGPIVQNISYITQRVDAIETDRRPLVERFIKVESLIPGIDKDLDEIKTDLKDVKNYLFNQ